MRRCVKDCIIKSKACEQKSCKFWINYEKEHNCSLVSIELNGEMTLHQVGERLGLSFVRVKQIQDKCIEKIKLLTDQDVLSE